jgi:hypothetical protein
MWILIQIYRTAGPEKNKGFLTLAACNPSKIIHIFSSSSRDLDEAMEFESQNSAKVIFVLFFF